MLDPELQMNVIKDIALLKLVGMRPVVVHGGGKTNFVLTQVIVPTNPISFPFTNFFSTVSIPPSFPQIPAAFTPEVAKAVGAEKLAFLTDTEGVYKDPTDLNSLISVLSLTHAEKLIQEGWVGGGMIPKLKNCMEAVKNGVARVHILDGRKQHCLLLEFFTDRGIGTAIISEE